MTSFKENNRYWTMTSRPQGNDFDSCLELREEASIPFPDGTFITKNMFLSMDAGTRMYMTEREDSYQPPIPVGEKLMGTVLGEIIASRHPDFNVGQRLRSYGQWSDYSHVDPKQMFPSIVDDSEIDFRITSAFMELMGGRHIRG